MEWTNEQVENLIVEYQRRPSLWDPGDPQHRRSAAKYEAWHKMAEIFECDIADVRKKLTSVFASYRRERAKVHHGRPSYWFLYDRLSFLPNHVPNAPDTSRDQRKHCVPRGSHGQKRKACKSSSEESDNSDDGDDDGDVVDLQSDVEVKQEPRDEEDEYEEPTKIHTKRRLTRGGQEAFARVPEFRRDPEIRRDPEVREPDIRRDGKDECDSFGEYIAMSLRKHDDRTRATMKQAINNIIFELEMKKYTSEPYTVVASDLNPLKGYGT